MAEEATIQDVFERVEQIADKQEKQFDSKRALKEILAYAESQFGCHYKEHHERCLACQKIGTVVDMARKAVGEDE